MSTVAPTNNTSIPAVSMGIAIAVFVTVVYIFTLCPFAYPIISAPLIAGHLGLEPLGGLQQPMWGLLLAIAERVPVGTLVLRCNFLSVPFAVLSVWLMFRLVSSIGYPRSTSERSPKWVHRFPQTVSGITAALFLAFSPPFWYCATVAHPASLQVFLLLACVAQLVAARRNPNSALKRYVAFAFIYGLATIDFPTLYLLAPVFGVYLLYVMLLNSQLTVRNVLGIVGSGLLGYAFLLPLLWRYMLTDSYQWQGFSGFGHLLWMFIKSQGIILLRGTPRVGWLLVALFSILPWFAVMLVSRAPQKKQRSNFGAALLLLVLYACGLTILFNQQLAPFRLLGLGNLLVTPYVFVAWWFGYLTGYWVFALLRQSPQAKCAPGAVRLTMARLIPAGAGIAIAVAAWLNYPAISPRQASPIVAMADAAVDDLKGRTWLISNGQIDANLALVAHERGIPLKLISVSRMSHAAYRKYLASLFESPRLKAMADIGLNPLIGEWSKGSSDWQKQVAVLSQPDLWYALGYEPVPSNVLYHGRPADRETNEFVPNKEPAVWQEILDTLEAVDQPPKSIDPYLTWVRNHFGKLANNWGVALADQKQPLAADAALQTAQRIDEENISALLNRYSLSQEADLPDKDKIVADIEAFTAEKGAKMPVWALSYHYGYVRSPEAFLQRGWSWAISGKPAVAIQELERAVAAGVSEDGMQLALAALYYQGGRELEAEQKYYAHLKKNPSDLRALMALSRIAIQKNDYDTARSYLARMLDAGAPANQVRSELASVSILQGRTAQAQSLLEKVLEIEPENQRALGLLAMLAAREGSTESITKLVERIRMLPEPNPGSLIIVSVLAEMDGDLETARADLDRVIEQRPGHVLALERLLNLDVKESRMDLAEKHVRALLNGSPRNARANQVLGSIQYERGELVAAEASLRVSVEEQPTAQALNSLGWLVLESGQPQEALDLSERALQLNPNIGHAWDTKGMALLALNRLPEAEKALIRAVECEVSHPSSNLHLAELYLKQGRNEQAERILNALQSRGGELPADLFNKVTTLLNDLKQTY